VLADEHWCPPPLSGEGVSLTNEGSRALGLLAIDLAKTTGPYCENSISLSNDWSRRILPIPAHAWEGRRLTQGKAGIAKSATLYG
jgi:hypothetical protein